jgi:hypothetical protein
VSDVLLSSPLIQFYVLYVVVLLVVCFFPGRSRTPRRVKDVAPDGAEQGARRVGRGKGGAGQFVWELRASCSREDSARILQAIEQIRKK